GVDAGEGADRAGDGAGGDLRPSCGKPGPVAREFGIVAGELEAEGGGLGMDAVAAPDAEGELVLLGAAAERGQQPVEVVEQDVAGTRELDREAGIKHVRGGHALVHEPRLGADMLAEAGQEGDDVVLRLALDLVDARNVEAAPLPD